MDGLQVKIKYSDLRFDKKFLYESSGKKTRLLVSRDFKITKWRQNLEKKIRICEY